MARASNLFTEEQKKTVAEAVAEAEKKTSGEIVPVVATRSGRYDRAEDIFGVIVGLVAVAALWLLFQGVTPRGGDWETGYTLRVELWVVLVTFGCGFLAGAALSTCVPVLCRPFVGRREVEEEVRRAAERAFFQFRVRRTEAGTGVVLYVSLFERRVVVLGDEPISHKVDQSHWDEVRDLIVGGLRQGKPAEGICSAVVRCGELLAEHFPIAPADVNELTNELRLID